MDRHKDGFPIHFEDDCWYGWDLIEQDPSYIRDMAALFAKKHRTDFNQVWRNQRTLGFSGWTKKELSRKPYEQPRVYKRSKVRSLEEAGI